MTAGLDIAYTATVTMLEIMPGAQRHFGTGETTSTGSAAPLIRRRLAPHVGSSIALRAGQMRQAPSSALYPHRDYPRSD